MHNSIQRSHWRRGDTLERDDASSATIATSPSCATIAINPSSGTTAINLRSATAATKRTGDGAELRRFGSASRDGSSARDAYVHSRL